MVCLQYALFQLEKAVPLELETDEVKFLKGIYEQIMKECRSDTKDKFPIIASYVHTLLLHVRRLQIHARQMQIDCHEKLGDHEITRSLTGSFLRFLKRTRNISIR
jgi:AraC family transcriptional activator of pobA